MSVQPLPQPQDAVSRYLASQGIESEAAYFAGSGFVLGRLVRLQALVVILRLEGEALLICDCQAIQGPKGIRSAVSEFITLVHQIEQQVPEVKEIRGLLRTSGTPAEQQLRLKLAEVLKKQGAVSTLIEGDEWLCYYTRSHRSGISHQE